jgi:uncharacterized protein (TIGR02246 family)
MGSVRLIALVLVAILQLPTRAPIGRGAPPSKGENVEQQIEALQEQGRQAALKGDSSFVEKCFADDYVGVAGDGQMRTKAEVMQMYKSASFKYESINERSVKIRTYGDTAIVNTEASVKFTLNGKPFSSDSRTVFVWVKQKGNWKLVTSQSTRVAP